MTLASRPRPPHRRAVLRRLLALGLGAGAVVAVRWQLAWPAPQVAFREGGSSGWMRLPARGGLIALTARIGRARVGAVVDSGAQFSAIDAELARRLDLPAATPLPMVAFGVSGGPRLTRAVRLDADLGGVSLTGLRAATLSLLPLTRLTRQPFSLLLGRDFLQAVVAEADFPAARVAFHAPESWVPPPAARPVPVRLAAGGLMPAVSVEGGAPVSVLLDTGATGPLALSEKTARAAGLLDGRPLSVGESVTVGGVSQDGVARAREIVFAGHRLTDVEVQIYHPARHAPVPAGLLGMGVLKRFHLAMDHAQGRLFMIGETPGRAG
jgi:predicted aspartyl protease